MELLTSNKAKSQKTRKIALVIALVIAPVAVSCFLTTEATLATSLITSGFKASDANSQQVTQAYPSPLTNIGRLDSHVLRSPNSDPNIFDTYMFGRSSLVLRVYEDVHKANALVFKPTIPANLKKQLQIVAHKKKRHTRKYKKRAAFKLEKVTLKYIRKVAKVFQYPVLYPVKGVVSLTSGFGYRRHPIFKRRKLHKGIDIVSRNRIIFASAGGRIAYAGRARGYGKMVEIVHTGGYKTRYAHLSRIYVKRGQYVRMNHRIGHMGRTGHVTGVHLHFEIIYRNKHVNPLRLLKVRNLGRYRR